METSCNTTEECCIDDNVTHLNIRNRPGLSSISYRIATHGRFKDIMLSRLDFWALKVLERSNISRNENGEEELTSQRDNIRVSNELLRLDEDLTTAIIDSWAVVADVLTFYQERIANEGFLRTAKERRSLIELGRTTGYELRPGVGASTLLAFSLEEAQGAAEKAIIDIGTKVQSLPGQDEKAQIFETTEKIEARQEWNSLKPRNTYRRKLFSHDFKFVLAEMNLKLKTGDLVLLVLRENSATTFQTFFRIIDRIELDQTSQQTTIYTHDPLKPSSNGQLNGEEDQDQDNGSNEVTIDHIEIEGKIFSLTHFSESQLRRYALDLKWEKIKFERFLNMIVSNEANTQNDEGLYIFDTKCNIFGHNAPKYRIIPQPPPPRPISQTPPNSPQVLKEASDTAASIKAASLEERNLQIGQKDPPPLIVGSFETELSLGSEPLWDRYKNKDISINEDSQGKQHDGGANQMFLDITVPGIVLSSFVVLQKPKSLAAYQVEATEERTLADFSISSKATGITINQTNLTQKVDLSQFKLRRTTVYAASKKLELAPYKKGLKMEKNNIELDKLITGLRIGQYVSITGKTLTTNQTKTDLTGSVENEIAELSEISHKNGYTVIRFKEDLKNVYKRDTVTINANLAKASHGETKIEVLGGGDPSKKFQEFALKQKPLTYISATSETGILSSLEIRINDILWREVPNLFEAGPSDHVYLVRNDYDDNNNYNNKTARVIFGNGIRGARPQAGKENIKAKFRVGIGKEGLLREGQLSLLMTRPLGVRSVVNPMPTSGADDPESLDKARRNASLRMLAMGRIISLKDVEDFTRAFAGIAKSQATWVWNGEKKIVHLTIAPVTGMKIADSDLLYKNLVKAIEMSKDPGISVAIHSFEPRFFNLEARVGISSEFLVEKVLDEIRRTLVERFSFESRDLGQPVRIHEVVNTIQKVNGVESVDIDKLYNSVGDASLQKYIESNNTKWEDEEIVPAQCLTINTSLGGIVLREAGS